jgi:hypothetical protein
MFVVGQTVSGTDEVPELNFDIVGSTGNIYKTTVGKVPTCNCPDARKGNQCKHICYGKPSLFQHPCASMDYSFFLLLLSLASLYLSLMANAVLVKVLKAPSHLQYQLAFLSSVSASIKSSGDKLTCL